MYSVYDPMFKRMRCVVIFFILTPFSMHGHEGHADDLLQEVADNAVTHAVSADQDGEVGSITQEPVEEEDQYEADGKRIAQIVITGNRLVPTDAILDRIPYRIGEIFDESKTRTLIQRLYFDLKRFRNISVYAKDSGPDSIILYIALEEKPVLQDVIIQGNKKITEKEIREKIPFADIQAIDEQELKQYARAINKLYQDRGYHNIQVDSSFVINEQNQGIATFTITEHKRAVVKRINFTGNHSLSGKQLRNVIFTRQDWVLSFMDKTGIFQLDRIDADKRMIEQFYQNNGFLTAKVVDAIIDIDNKTSSVNVTYEIQEGDKYTVSDVTVSGNDILKEEYLESVVPVKVGDFYSREKIVESIKILELVWGDLGYVYTHIDPSVIPDEEKKTVSISFNAEIGSPVQLNKLTIKGNKKTRDKVIRRSIALEEGRPLTNRAMEASKNRIESLGFFDQRDGVNWKMTRLDEQTADLDLIVKEAKTGSANAKLGFGGAAVSMASPADSVSLEVNVADTNLFGSGVRFNVTGRLGGEEKTIAFNLTQPWLFDKPVFGSIDLYHKRLGYDDFTQTRAITEKYSGGVVTAGFVTGAWHALMTDTFIRFSVGVDDVRYEGNTADGKRCSTASAAILRANTIPEQEEARAVFDRVLAKLFHPGTFATWGMQMGRDAKNHPIHPTKGYAWVARSLFAASGCGEGNIGFSKVDLDVNWLTPLIGDFDLIFRLHMNFGVVIPFGRSFVPYRELFHIGGPNSVRGFLFGQIGPQFCTEYAGKLSCDSIGGTKAMFLNAELIFPITNDFTMKGVLFYDGGAGWDNPYKCDIPDRFLMNNRFDYRHAVGFGLRLLQPMPIKIDWGFKLDPRKGETAQEVHFAMTYDW